MRTVACFVLILVSAVAFCQDYHVLNVKGTVTIGGRALRPNDKLKSDDKIVFSAKTDAIAVASAKQGRFIISPSTQKKQGELIAYVKDVITPGTKKLSTRSGLFNNALDFDQYFKEPILLLPVMKYRTSYKQDDKDFFFIRYNYNGEEISKKLRSSGDTLVIIRDDLYSIDKNPIDPGKVSNVRLLYLHNSEIQTLAKMNLLSPAESELQDGVDVLRQLYPKGSLREETISYLGELYGKIDDFNFDQWFKKVN